MVVTETTPCLIRGLGFRVKGLNRVWMGGWPPEDGCNGDDALPDKSLNMGLGFVLDMQKRGPTTAKP
jgi:hypothetical protein